MPHNGAGGVELQTFCRLPSPGLLVPDLSTHDIKSPESPMLITRQCIRNQPCLESPNIQILEHPHFSHNSDSLCSCQGQTLGHAALAAQSTRPPDRIVSTQDFWPLIFHQTHRAQGSHISLMRQDITGRNVSTLTRCGANFLGRPVVRASAPSCQELRSPRIPIRFTDAPAGGQLVVIEVSDFHLGLLPNELAGDHEDAVPPGSQAISRPRLFTAWLVENRGHILRTGMARTAMAAMPPPVPMIPASAAILSAPQPGVDPSHQAAAHFPASCGTPGRRRRCCRRRAWCLRHSPRRRR